MSHLTLPAEGGCRCGAVGFRITVPPLMTMACHCRGCQRMTASAFSLSIAIPEDGFEVARGEPEIGGLHGAESRHHHCGWCKSWLFTRLPAPMGFVNVRTTMPDVPDPAPPFIETMTAEKLPWATTGAAHAFAGFPAMDAMGALLAEYADR